MNYQFKEEISKSEGKNFAYLTITLGAYDYTMFLSVCGYISVYRRVNGKASAIANPCGKTFHSWEEFGKNYKKLNDALPMIKAKALLLTQKAYNKMIVY